MYRTPLLGHRAAYHAMSQAEESIHLTGFEAYYPTFEVA